MINKKHPTYEAVTNDIRVTVQPVYLPKESRPKDNHFVWAYIVNVSNEGGDTVQLMRRHWLITDQRGITTEVSGAGVVGEQPVLEPGDCYEYTSGTPLATAHGIMHGDYQMQSDTGESFNIEIPAFALDSPYSRPTVN